MKNDIAGGGFVKSVLVLVVFVAFIYAGTAFGKPYFRYSALKSHTKELLQTEISDAEAIRVKVLAEAVELQIPLKDKDLEVTSQNKLVRVKASWSEVVDFWGYYQKKLDFVMEVEY